MPQHLPLTTHTKRDLINAAFEAKTNAYSPYSKFPVGAALLTSDGTVVKGASIDNISYEATLCAERTAIVKAVSDGFTGFVALAIVANVCGIISPCGLCRQVIIEFCPPEMPVLLVPGDYAGLNSQLASDSDDIVGLKETTVRDLFPNERYLQGSGVEIAW